MAGTPDNARIWADADVYVAFDPDEANPADIDTAFGAGWDLVGLLDGDEGFPESRDEDTSDHFAWGGILVRTSRRNFKLTRKFTALESPANNDTVFRLAWPGSTSTALVVPSGSQVERVKVAFETTDGDIKRRVISHYQAEITVDGEITENETDVAGVTFLVTVYPDADGNLFDVQQTAEASA